jgi:putative heme-binding domain-containing protein
MRANLASELPWNDTDYQIRQQCCRVAGDLKLADSQSQLIKRLEDPVALVRSHAAIALGKVGTKSATQSLLQLLQRNADLDPFIRHAAVTGLAGAATETQLAGKVKHESKSVRLGAVLALGRQKSSQVSRFLDDEHHQVVREAARAIHDDFSIVGALPDLANVLDRSTLPRDEPTMRRVISANFRIGDEAAAKRILNFILSPESLGDLSVPLKLEALDCLAAWNQSPIVDRVEGRIRKNARADLAAGRNVLQANLERLLATKDTQISAAVLRHLNDLKLEVNSENFRSWVTNTSLAPNARIEALRLLREQKDEQASSLIEKVVHGPTKDEVWRYAFALMVEDHPKDAIAAMDWDAPLDQQQLFIAMLPKIQSSAADKLLQQWVQRVADPNEPTRNVMLLDVLAAARQTKNKPPALPVLEKLVAAAPHGEYSFSKTGGNATRGEQIYRNHPNAQCVRCHNAGGQGRQAGPVLTQIGTKPKDYLLAALVAPSDTIAKGFESVTAVKEDGKMITGTVVSENDEVLMLGAPNKNYKIRKDEIEERIEAKQSAMPKMSEVLSAIQIRDVVEYLSTLR